MTKIVPLNHFFLFFDIYQKTQKIVLLNGTKSY